MRLAVSPLLACLAAFAANPSVQPLEHQLNRIRARAGGRIGISVVHLESRATATVDASQALPLYSVFKLPLAIVVLKDVEVGRLRLDQRVRVNPSEVSPGSRGNTERWKAAPVTPDLQQLLEYSLVDSDNTSSDKLLGLVGGPRSLVKRLRELGLVGIDIQASSREFASRSDHPNRASAAALTDLLGALHGGRLLRPQEQTVLRDMMGRSRTGIHRLRGLLPANTPVIDKTGTGGDGSVTNDVGIVTLPDNRGHLAIAVLMSGSKLPADAQEKLIAEVGRAAHDHFARR